MYARVSARVHESEKEKLKKSGRTARHAIEYFNKVSCTALDSLKIEEFFLNKDIEDLKLDLIAKEMKLEKILKKKDELYCANLSELRVESYRKIIGLFNQDNTNKSFDDFIGGTYVKDMINKEILGLDCSVDEYVEGLNKYYVNVIQIGMTD